jgi:hypothetical protein
MAITYFGSASNPADAEANYAKTTAVVPPADMAAGDLVIVYAQVSTKSMTIAVSEAGGQTWTSEAGQVVGNYTYRRIFWCRFDGTWDANPSFAYSGRESTGYAHSVVMHVFRPSNGANTWEQDVALITTTESVTAVPYTATLAGFNTATDGALALAMWGSISAARTYGGVGAPWSQLGSNNYRNTQGTYDVNCSFCYQVKASAGATGDAVQTMSGNTGTMGHFSLAFKEVAAGIDLVAAGGTQAQASDSPTTSVTHVLASAEGAQAQEGDTPALTGTHILVAVEGAQAQASDSPTTVCIHVLESAEGAQAQVSATPTVEEQASAIDLVPAEGAQAQASDAPTLTQTHALSANEGAQGQVSDAPALSQTHVVVAQEGAQAQVADVPALTQTHIPATAEGLQGQASDSPILAQTHVLATQGGIQPQESGVPELTQGSALSVDGGLQGQASDIPALTQVHALVVAGGTQASMSDEARIDRIIALMAAEGEQAQLSDSALLDLSIWLSIQEGRQSQAAAHVTLKAGGIPPESWSSKSGKYRVARTKRMKPGMKSHRWKTQN